MDDKLLPPKLTSLQKQIVHLKAQVATLEAENKALRELDELKDKCLSTTSHELRNPLTGIIGVAESLLEDGLGRLLPEQSYNLAMIAASGRRLTNLVNDVLDFHQLKHEGLKLQVKAINLREVTDLILTMSQPLVNHKRVQLHNRIQASLPLVTADETRLQQIIYNLIDNAIKFTETGKIEVTARVLSTTMVEVSITDSGIGISAEKIKQITQAFEQDEINRSHAYLDFGAGLTIIKQLVALHGGQLEVKSKVGHGTRFSFTLPISQVESADYRKPPQDMMRVREAMSKPILTTPSLSPQEGQKFKVLIVDDENLNRLILYNYLSLNDFEVIQAADGFEALDILTRITPDIILLDVMMPKLSGYDVCFKIRQTHPAHELPIVLLTARNFTADMLAGFEVGANDYLTKPFDKDELLARLRTHLNLAKINTAYGRFVPHEFLRLLERQSIVEVNLGDQVQKRMTTLFADVRNFTALSEDMTPSENFAFINSLLGEIGPVIRKYRGFIDKYIGDGIMALFPENVDDAVQAAIAMLRQLDIYNAKSHYKHPVRIGIGLHTGNLILGTVGEEQRMETTVISDVVNTASRLEELTKWYGVNLLISKDSFDQLKQPQNYQARFLDKVQVKGKRRPVEVYEIFDGDSRELRAAKQHTKADFERGAHHFYEQDFTATIACMQQVLTHFPHDKAAQLYMERAIKEE